MDIELKTGAVARFLFLMAATLTLAHVVAKLTEIYLGRTYGLYLFDFDREQSIPRLFSSVTLLLCCGLALFIALTRKKTSRRSMLVWSGLALFFLGLAVIEYTATHEYLVVLTQSALHLSKNQFYLLASGILLVVFPVTYLRFLRLLPRRQMILLAVGGIAFVVGAFGIDLIDAYLDTFLAQYTLAYLAFSTLEEVAEMAGIIIFVYALLSYLSLDSTSFRVKIT